MNKTKVIKKTKSNQKITPKIKNAPKDSKKSKADDQLAAIRNILFGEQILKLEQNIQNKFEMLNGRIDNLEKLISNNSDEFDKKLTASYHDLVEHLKTNDLKHVSHKSLLDKKLCTLDKNLDEFRHATEKDFVHTQDTLTHTANKINHSLNQEVKRLTEKIESTSKELSAKKADRKAIANLLESMASNLTQSQA